MGNKHAAEKLFWELVEDYDSWTRQQLASLQHQSTTAASKALAIAQTTAFLAEAASQAGKDNWETAAAACTDLAVTALNLLAPADFAAAKDVIWDMAMAAKIAAGKHAETFPEVQRALLRELASCVGNKVFAFVNPSVTGHPVPAWAAGDDSGQ
jgi:hypothetical protein